MATPLKGVRVFAPAKINLFLHVTRKRPDGFHDLQSLVVFADIGDSLLIERASEFSLAIDGPFASELAGEADNLVLKAARAFASCVNFDCGARFTLTKNLPVASGIGGGSADAAAALRGLAALCGWDASQIDTVISLSAEVGSDVPVCVASCEAWMEGRGERVIQLPAFPELHLVLINPRVGVSTREVFARLEIAGGKPELNPPGTFASIRQLVSYLHDLGNDLEAPACAIAPIVPKVLSRLEDEGAVLARMSGSGATCFGLFESAETAERAARTIRTSEPGWWTRACRSATAERAEAKPVSRAQ